jgi:hypothetical protein
MPAVAKDLSLAPNRFGLVKFETILQKSLASIAELPDTLAPPEYRRRSRCGARYIVSADQQYRSRTDRGGFKLKQPRRWSRGGVMKRIMSSVTMLSFLGAMCIATMNSFAAASALARAEGYSVSNAVTDIQVATELRFKALTAP